MVAKNISMKHQNNYETRIGSDKSKVLPFKEKKMNIESIKGGTFHHKEYYRNSLRIKTDKFLHIFTNST